MPTSRSTRSPASIRPEPDRGPGPAGRVPPEPGSAAGAVAGDGAGIEDGAGAGTGGGGVEARTTGAWPDRSRGARILGIDPGSRVTGYGVIEVVPGRNRHVASGCIRVAGDDMAGRLRRIVEGLREVSARYAPSELAIERVFVNRNAESALKLGQARGAALVAMPDIPVFEYAATRVKQATTGSGKASKSQVQSMVRVLLSLPETPPADEADALAVALCHANSRDMLARTRPDLRP